MLVLAAGLALGRNSRNAVAAVEQPLQLGARRLLGERPVRLSLFIAQRAFEICGEPGQASIRSVVVGT